MPTQVIDDGRFPRRIVRFRTERMLSWSCSPIMRWAFFRLGGVLMLKSSLESAGESRSASSFLRVFEERNPPWRFANSPLKAMIEAKGKGSQPGLCCSLLLVARLKRSLVSCSPSIDHGLDKLDRNEGHIAGEKNNGVRTGVFESGEHTAEGRTVRPDQCELFSRDSPAFPPG